MLFALISLVAGFGLGIYSLIRARAFVLVLFGVLPLLAYFSHFFIDIDPHYSMTSEKSVWGNISGLFMEIPEEFRLAAILFFPAMIAGRIYITVYLAKQKNAIMSKESLDRKREKILKSHGMSSWHS